MKYVWFVVGCIGLISSSWLLLHHTEHINQPHKLKAESLLVIATQEGEGTQRVTVQSEGVFKRQYELMFTKETVADITIGAHVLVSGRAEPIEHPKNKYLFDYKKYSYSIGTFHQMFNPKIRLQEKASMRGLIYQGKEQLQQYIHATFAGETKIFLQALFLKDTHELKLQYSALTEIGLLQIFTISVLGVKRVQRLIVRVCGRIRRGKLLEVLLAISLVYVCHIYFWQSVSLQYLFVNCVFGYLNDYLRRWKLVAAERLALTGMILMACNPYVIFNLGFIFIFVLRFGLLLSTHYSKQMKRYQRIFVFPLLLFGLMLPITIYMQQSIALGQILFYIVAAPLNVIVFVVGFAVLFMPGLSFMFQSLTSFVIACYEAWLPVYELLTIKLSWYFSLQSFGLYILYFLFLRPKWVKNKGRNIVLIICFIGATHVLNTSLGSIHFLSLPYGEMTIIKAQGLTYVIDVGGSHKESDNIYQTETIILPFLQQLQIEQIDHLILTHDDIDHVGDFAYLLAQFPVLHVYYHESTLPFQELASKYNDVAYHQVKTLSQVGALQIFPVYDASDKTISTNNLSLVTYGYFGGKRWLFMGDLEQAGEQKLIRMYPSLTVDVLKLGHHGSKTSSSSAFLRRLRPQYGIITVQKRNRHNHPHDEVIQRLRDYEMTYYNTNTTGSIHFFFWHHFGIFVIE
jgi:competence protein ComEC